jgi:translation initiation factor IF-2
MVTATQSLPDEMIEIFAAEIGARVQLVDAGEEDEAALQAKYFDKDDAEEVAAMKPRPPVVTVMGHVDHGKTMLLDRVRETNVVAQEAGGITQHIGAYQVDVTGHGVTFIDTPGHEAFTAMRARGAQVTDIVVLVVAADDGVMPQTVEAIDHAKAAGTPIVVAINKIDRESADPDRVRQQLSEHGLVPESWGGDTIMVEVSALANTGVSALLEQLLVVAEVEELKANPEIAARAIVLEANLDTGRGPVATVIVQAGTLRVGDYVVAGSAWGRVKALVSDRGENVKEAPPAMPVRLLGFSKPPVAGDELRVVGDQGVARAIAEARDRRARHTTHLASVSVAPGTKLEDVFARIQSGEVSTLNLILKADVQGSLEAITDSLQKLETDEVKLDLIHRGVGGVTENDVQLAAASNAAIIAFNVRPDRRARELAEARKVDIRTYEVIYKVMEDLAAAMKGLLAPTFEEVVTGEAEVRAIFRVPRIGAIAGCMVRNGVIKRGSKVRFLRDGVVIWNGSVSSLRRHKDDVREVAAGFECGIGLSDFQDLHEGDVIETYEEREVEPATT